MLDRIMRAIRLDRTLFRQVADNPEYMNEAIIIAVAVAVVAGIGALFSPEQPVLGFVGRFINELLFGWVLWAAIAYVVGTNMFRGRSSVKEMMRTLAYASAPRLLGVFGVIPCVGWLFAIVGWALSIIAGVIAIRESMEFDNSSAVITAVLGLILYIVASVIIGLLLSPVSILPA